MNYYRQLFLETVPGYKKVERRQIQGTRQWYKVFAKIGDEFITEERIANSPYNAIREFINHTLKQHEIRTIKHLNNARYIYIRSPETHLDVRFKTRKKVLISTEKLAVVYIHGLEDWEDLIEIVATPKYVSDKAQRDILYSYRTGKQSTDPDFDIETELF